MSTIIQVRDASAPNSGYFDAAGVSMPGGTAALRVTSGRSGSLIPTGTSASQQIKVGKGELSSIAAIGTTSTATVSAYDAATLAAIAPENLIWEGVATNTPAVIDYPLSEGLVLAFSEPTTSNVRVVSK